MGKVEENKRQKEATILSVGVELFASKGFEETTISDIVAASGLSRGTFYNYFPDKEAIWNRCLEEILGTINAQLIEERQNAATVHDFLYNTFYSYLNYFTDPLALALILRNQPIFRKTLFSTHSIGSIYAHLEKDLRESTFFTGLQPQQFKMISYAMIGTGIELLIQSHQNGNAFPMEDLANFFKDVFWVGIRGMLEQADAST